MLKLGVAYSNLVGNQLCGSLGQLGTPVGNVGQNNPNATRLVPDPGSLSACSGPLLQDGPYLLFLSCYCQFGLLPQ